MPTAFIDNSVLILNADPLAMLGSLTGGYDECVSLEFLVPVAITSKVILYKERHASSGDFIEISVNDGVSGMVQYKRVGLGGTNTQTLQQTGSYNDGKRHRVTCFRFGGINSTPAIVSRNVGMLIDDNVEIYNAGSTVGVTCTVNIREIGPTNSSSTNRVIVGDLAIFVAPLSLAQHKLLYNRKKNPLNISRYADLKSYYTLWRGDRDDQKQFNAPISYPATNVDTDWSDYATPPGLSIGKLGDYSTIPAIFHVSGAGGSLINGTASTNYAEYREPSNIYYSESTGKYYCWLTGTATPYSSNQGNTSIFRFEKVGWNGTWTRTVHPTNTDGAVIHYSNLPTEDFYVNYDVSTKRLRAWAENKTGGNNSGGISQWYSSDEGLNWVKEFNTAVDKGVANSMSYQDASSPVTYNNPILGRMEMLYEGRANADGTGSAFRAFTLDWVTWTRIGLAMHDSFGGELISGVLAGRAWDGYSVVVDDIFQIGSTWWLFYHGSNGTNVRGGIAFSNDLETWYRPERNQISRLGLNAMICQQTGEMMVFQENTSGGEIALGFYNPILLFFNNGISSGVSNPEYLSKFECVRAFKKGDRRVLSWSVIRENNTAFPLPSTCNISFTRPDGVKDILVGVCQNAGASIKQLVSQTYTFANIGIYIARLEFGVDDQIIVDEQVIVVS